MKVHRTLTLGVVAALALGTSLVAGTASATSAPAAPAARAGTGWVGTWAASPMEPTPLQPNPAVAGFDDQTVRNIVFTSIGGSQVRVRLSNAFGSQQVTVGRATVANQLVDANLAAKTRRTLTFGGHRSTSIPAGAQVVSDPVRLRVRPLENLAVSIYLPEPTGPATFHSSAHQTTYIAAGDHARDARGTAFDATTESWYFVAGVDVRTDHARAGEVVAFGDSITDGTASQTDANQRWPNDLARRLDAALGNRAPGVVDEGIGGNRVLHNSECFGVNALARLNRDVLGQTGVRTVILMEGINDIGFSESPNSGCTSPNTDVSVQQIIHGYQQIIARAHAHGLTVVGSTLTPFKGAGYWSRAGERKREAVNRWIRTSGAFDGVADFAAATANRFDRQRFNPVYDSGDHLHPNDAGYHAMADSIDLSLLH